MKQFKQLLLLLTLLFAVSAQAQYNPTDPPEPGMTYKLTLSAVPAGSGYVYGASDAVSPGQSVSLSASPASGFVFVQWEDEEGNVISTTSSWTYTMPGANTRLIARFRYSPNNPGEPTPAPQYANVVLKVNPSGAGSASGGGKFAVGSSVYVYAYGNSGFKFKNWTLGEEVVSTNASFDYVVRAGDNTLTANYDYSPDSPAEPVPSTPKHKLYLKANPSNAASFNMGNGNSFDEGSLQYVYAYPTTGFNFLNWTDEEGNVISNSQGFNYKIPAKNSTITANLEYSPANPSDPGTTSPRRNVIYGSRKVVEPGSQTVFHVQLDNLDDVTGISADITVPEGYKLDFENATLTDRAGVHTLTAQLVEGATYRVSVRGTEKLAGGAGSVIRIPLTVPADAEPGSSVIVPMAKGVVVKADGNQDPVDAINGIIKIAEAQIGLPDSPDFKVTDLKADAVSVMPGDEVSISWNVVNDGTIDATGGWSETVWLVDLKMKLPHLIFANLFRIAILHDHLH